MIRIYTDGAWRRKDKAAGAAAVIVWPDSTITIVHRYLGDVTNNCAELHAIALGLNRVIKRVGIWPEIIVFSDSTYAVGILTQKWKAKANVELITSIKATIDQFEAIKFKWVKGHSKDKYNRLADLVANIAIDQHLGIDLNYSANHVRIESTQ